MGMFVARTALFIRTIGRYSSSLLTVGGPCVSTVDAADTRVDSPVGLDDGDRLDGREVSCRETTRTEPDGRPVRARGSIAQTTGVHTMEATASRKVPDGKLVRVRVEYGDRLERVELRGDFFLEPPSALTEIERALEGVPADASVDRLAEAVDSVDARLIGFDAGDVATAIREAIDG
jgi:lipoate-protein ligase A